MGLRKCCPRLKRSTFKSSSSAFAVQAHLLGLPGRQRHTVGVDVLGGGACCAQCSCRCLQILQWGEMTIGFSQTSQALAEALTTSQACTPPLLSQEGL
jgi:hypothetical protein